MDGAITKAPLGGLLLRWSKRTDTYLALLHFACGIITWRAAGLLG